MKGLHLHVLRLLRWRPRRRAAIVLAVLALLGGWVWIDRQADETTGTPPPKPATVAPPGAAPHEAAPTVPEAPTAPVDIFAVRNWEPPPPPPPAPGEAAPAAPPAPPQAPPLPFRYLGRLDEGGEKPVYFLARGPKVLSVSPGDVIEGNYRVGTLKGGRIPFLYRPMKVEQYLAVGGSPP